jgi:chromosome segregation ATPase
VLLVVSAALLGLVAVSCRTNGAPEADLSRIRRVESTLSEVSGTTARLNDQIATLRQSLEGTDAGMATELGSVKGSVDELRASLDALRKDLSAARGADAGLQKKLDELSAKVSGIDQRLWVLEARYNDHLRKLHGQQ